MSIPGIIEDFIRQSKEIHTIFNDSATVTVADDPRFTHIGAVTYEQMQEFAEKIDILYATGQKAIKNYRQCKRKLEIAEQYSKIADEIINSEFSDESLEKLQKTTWYVRGKVKKFHTETLGTIPEDESETAQDSSKKYEEEF